MVAAFGGVFPGRRGGIASGRGDFVMGCEVGPDHSSQVITSDEFHFQNFIRPIAAGRGDGDRIPDLLADQRLGKGGRN